MDHKTTEHHLPPADDQPRLPQNAKWVVGMLVGIGTGLTKFVTDVRSKFYENVSSGPDFKSKLEAHGEKLGQLKEQRRAGKLTTSEFIKEWHHQKNAFNNTINEFSEELGILSKDWKTAYTTGTVQRFQTLSRNTRTPLVFGAITTTVIGFAGTSMFMNGLANRKKLDTISKKTQEAENNQRA